MTKPDAARHAPGEIDAYLAAQPDDVRAALERVRSIVRATAPDCTERVSYGVPIFRQGKDLVGLSAQKDHCALHSMSPGLMKTIRVEFRGFKVSGATIHFTPEAPLSRDLIEAIVRARLAELETV